MRPLRSTTSGSGVKSPDVATELTGEDAGIVLLSKVRIRSSFSSGRPVGPALSTSGTKLPSGANPKTVPELSATKALKAPELPPSVSPVPSPWAPASSPAAGAISPNRLAISCGVPWRTTSVPSGKRTLMTSSSVETISRSAIPQIGPRLPSGSTSWNCSTPGPAGTSGRPALAESLLKRSTEPAGLVVT